MMSTGQISETVENILPRLCKYDLGELTVYHFVNEQHHKQQIIKDGFKTYYRWQGVHFSYIPNLATGGSSELLLIANIAPKRTFDLASASQEESWLLAQYMISKRPGLAALTEFFRSEEFDSYIEESGGAYFTSPRDERGLVVLNFDIIKKVRIPTPKELEDLTKVQ